MEVAEIQTLLEKWLQSRLSESRYRWFKERQEPLKRESQERYFGISFSLIPRELGKEDLKLTLTELQEASRLCPGWSPHHWTLDQSARIALLLSFPEASASIWTERLESLFQTGDMGEWIALYQGLPFYPWPESHCNRAMEGIRTTMKAVFEAVAHFNPYPYHYFSIAAWNQMILKALFIGSPLAPIYGLSLRSTPELSRMLSDYAEERWAAKRTIPLELWRCLGNYFTEPLWKLLEIRLAQGEEQEQKALVLALLALQEARSLPRSQELLSSVPRLHHAALAQEFNWNSLQRMQSISLK